MRYEADLDWPAYGFGDRDLLMSGVAVSAEGALFSFDRASRPWKDKDRGDFIDRPTIRKWQPDGTLIDELGAGLFLMPHSISIGPAGELWVTDVGRHQIMKLSPGGALIETWGTERKPGRSATSFCLPTDIAFTRDGSFYLSDGYGNARIAKFSSNGAFEFEWGTKGDANGQFHLPHSVDLDEEGQVYVADRENERIQIFDPQGRHIETLAGEEIGKPFAIAVSDALICVADCGFPQQKRSGLVVIDRATRSVNRFGAFGSSAGDLMSAHDIAIAQDGSIYIADAVRGLLKFSQRAH